MCLSDRIASILSELNKSPYTLGLILDHQYTKESLSENGLRALKGVDNDRYSLLAQANELLTDEERKLAFYICHAGLEIFQQDNNQYRGRRRSRDKFPHTDGYDPDSDGYDWEVYDRGSQLDEWYEASGKNAFVRTDLKFLDYIFEPGSDKTDKEIDLTDEDNWGEYENIDFESYTGNAGATKTTIYSKSILAFWPRRYETNVRLRLGANFAINSYYRLIVGEDPKLDTARPRIVIIGGKTEPPGEDLSYLKEFNKELILSDILEFLIKSTQKNITSYFGRLLRMVEKSGNLEHSKCLLQHSNPFPLTSEHLLYLMKIVARFGFEPLKESLAKFFQLPTVKTSYKHIKIVKMIHSECNQPEIALKYFKEFMVPLLSDSANLNQLVKLLVDYRPPPPAKSNNPATAAVESIEQERVKILLAFCKGLQLFDQHTPEIVERFVETVRTFMSENEQFASFVVEVLSNEASLKTSRPFVRLFEDRKQWIRQKVEEDGVASMKYDKQLKEIDTFLSI